MFLVIFVINLQTKYGNNIYWYCLISCGHAYKIIIQLEFVSLKENIKQPS